MSGGREYTPYQLKRWARWSKGGGTNGLTKYWENKLKGDVEGGGIRITVDINMAGHNIGIATNPMKTTSSVDASGWVYHPMMAKEPEIDLTYDIGVAAAGVRQINFSFPNQFIDCSAVINNGGILAGWCEASFQYDGGDWDRRFVLMRGDIGDGVTFGDKRVGLVSGSFSDPQLSGDLNLPPQVIDTDSMPRHDTAWAGHRYPLVFNDYKSVPCALVDTSPATNYVGVTFGANDFAYLLGIGHDWTADYVYQDGAIPVGQTWDQVNVYDGIGTPVTLLKIDTLVRTVDTSTAFHADVSRSSGETRHLIDHIQRLVEQFSGLQRDRIDYELFARARSRLGAEFPVSALINASDPGSSVRTMEYIETGLLASFPMVSMVYDTGGYGPIVTDRRDKRYRAKLQRNTFPLGDRISEITESPKEEMYNSFSLRYDFRYQDNSYWKTLQKDRDSSSLCEASFNLVGPRHHEDISSPHIFENSTANSVIDWLIEHKTLPSYYVEYEAYPWAFFYLKRGDNVSLTDDDFGWTDVTATVKRLKYVRGKTTVGLVVWWSHYNLGGGSRTW